LVPVKYRAIHKRVRMCGLDDDIDGDVIDDDVIDGDGID
jgi:hypothetical protein